MYKAPVSSSASTDSHADKAAASGDPKNRPPNDATWQKGPPRPSETKPSNNFVNRNNFAAAGGAGGSGPYPGPPPPHATMDVRYQEALAAKRAAGAAIEMEEANLQRQLDNIREQKRRLLNDGQRSSIHQHAGAGSATASAPPPPALTHCHPFLGQGGDHLPAGPDLMHALGNNGPPSFVASQAQQHNKQALQSAAANLAMARAELHAARLAAAASEREYMLRVQAVQHQVQLANQQQQQQQQGPAGAPLPNQGGPGQQQLANHQQQTAAASAARQNHAAAQRQRAAEAQQQQQQQQQRRESSSKRELEAAQAFLNLKHDGRTSPQHATPPQQLSANDQSSDRRRHSAPDLSQACPKSPYNNKRQNEVSEVPDGRVGSLTGRMPPGMQQQRVGVPPHLPPYHPYSQQQQQQTTMGPFGHHQQKQFPPGLLHNTSPTGPLPNNMTMQEHVKEKAMMGRQQRPNPPLLPSAGGPGVPACLNQQQDNRIARGAQPAKNGPDHCEKQPKHNNAPQVNSGTGPNGVPEQALNSGSHRSGALPEKVKSTSRKRNHQDNEEDDDRNPNDMPRRPLSAYNFFFSEERQRIISSIPDPDNPDGENESVPNAVAMVSSSSHHDNTEKKMMLIRHLIRERKRRPHRKTHGKVGFKTLAKMVGQRWRSLPPERVRYYKELAELDLQRYRDEMAEYNARKANASMVEAAAAVGSGGGAVLVAPKDATTMTTGAVLKMEDGDNRQGEVPSSPAQKELQCADQ